MKRITIFIGLLCLLLIPGIVSAEGPYSGTPYELTGAEPLNVTFTDASTGTPTSWNWTKTDVTGAGVAISFSTAQNPTHVFYAGNWSIQLTATNAFGTNTTNALVAYVNVTGAAGIPVANFTGAPTTIYEGESVTFNDTSTGTPTSWVWKYYANNDHVKSGVTFSTNQNPVLTTLTADHNAAGITSLYYEIELTASNAAGSNVESKTSYILVNPPPAGAPVANFTPTGTLESSGYSYIRVVNGTTISFNDTSTGSPTEWAWIITNSSGTTYPTTQNASALFETFRPDGDVYTVQLTASSAAGSSSLLKYVAVTTPPVIPIPQFQVSVNGVLVTEIPISHGSTTVIPVKNGDTIYLADCSYNDPTMYVWNVNMGNGTSMSGYNSTYSFAFTNAAESTYQGLAYMVSNAAGSDTMTATSLFYINDTSPPASISPPTNSTAPTQIIWNWTNPATDLAYVSVWKDGTLFENVTGHTTTWTGLSPSTTYTISTRTVDAAGNMNASWVNASATTTGYSWNWTSSSYWVCPDGVTNITLKLTGGGGSGKGGGSYAGGGGYAGEAATHSRVPVTPGANYTITVGLRGANSTYGTDSNAGTYSQFGTDPTYRVEGGLGGITLTGENNGGDGETGAFSLIRYALNGTNASIYNFGIAGTGYGAGGGGASFDPAAPLDTMGGYGAGGFVEISVYGYAGGNVPEFSASTTSGAAGSLITFTDLSTIINTGDLSYNWSFGDGEYSSTIGQVNHVYDYNGVYDVALRITATGEDVTELKAGYITIYNKPTAWTVYNPWNVRIKIVDAFGVPLPGANISVTYIASTLPSTDTAFLTSAFGVDQSVAEAMATSSLAMSGTTADDGSTTFLMFPILTYGVTITNSSAGLNNYRTLNPKDQDYLIRCPLTSQRAENDTLTAVTTSKNLFYRLNSTHYNLSMIYQDANGYTTNLRFKVYDYSNGNTLVYDHNLGNPGTAVVTDNYTVYLPLGQEYRWGYNCSKI